MNEPIVDSPSPDKAAYTGLSSQDDEPEFGLVDVIEAFTAMRHEWRGQAKEGRQLAEQLQATVRKLEEFESTRTSRASESSPDENPELKQLARAIADTDHQLSRAIRAMEQDEQRRGALQADQREAVTTMFEGMNPLARWMVRPLFALCMQQHNASSLQENRSLEGLHLVLARLRQVMREQGVERIDVLGEPFDGSIMNAIDAVDSSDYLPGHVAEQLMACYRWKNSILRFANVRVAQAPPTETE